MTRSKNTLPWLRICLSVVGLSLVSLANANGQEFIPRTQKVPPGPAISPKEAIQKMQVPEGFHVELVAAEPSIQNPVAMAFDDAGRIYVTESFEYPRREPGPGRDTIKILQDKDGDGLAETVKVFAEGLNIPSGIAIGYGGVWVANSPDILFLEDTDGDDKADKQTIIVTGFGRDDTHELPSALTWGPDGYLYGLNGVFNRSVVKQDGKTFDFTCALFRIDPRTKKFELFCEGTSNPWGVTFNHEGSAFVSACVIDHLWHLSESAYYRRQGGPYPPHTFFAESIVKHKHQMAAYCGIEFFDSEAYPAKFRDRLYMGNIHGGCINSDSIERNGATYRASGEPDFLTANDVWFMPVAQKVGPDGCLYVLDWYDRYHCYQDANADPKGVDRGHGRLYRVVHQQRPKQKYADIAKLTDDQCIDAIADPNIFIRQRAQLHLQQRGASKNAAIASRLQSMVFQEKVNLKYRMHALWSLIGSGSIPADLVPKLLESAEPELRAWGVRTAGQHRVRDEKILQRVSQLSQDSDLRVRLEVSVAAPKIANGSEASRWNIQQQLSLLPKSGTDPLLSRVVWQNMLPQLAEQQTLVLESILASEKDSELLELAPRFAKLLASNTKANLEDDTSRRNIQAILKLAKGLASKNPPMGAQVIDSVLDKSRNLELQTIPVQSLVKQWLEENASASLFVLPDVKRIQEWTDWETRILQSNLLVANANALELTRSITLDSNAKPELKRQLIQNASQIEPKIVKENLIALLQSLAEGKDKQQQLRDTILDLGIARADAEDAKGIVAYLPKMNTNLQASIAERLCQRNETAAAILEQMANGAFRKELLSPNRVRLLATSNQASIKEWVTKIWGNVNVESSKEREDVIQRATSSMRWDARGDAERGWVVYDRICGQCHVMHGRGYEVGPNITSNGRGSYEQLLVSVFNPSLVIGESYQSITIRTKDDQIVTGLLVDRNDKRTVLKIQGGKEQTILEEDIDEFKRDKKSLMPEGIEKQMTPQEMADLFALLTLEKAPTEKSNSKISGTPDRLHDKNR